MAFDGATWSNTTPTDSDLANQIDDNMRDMKIGVQGRANREHVWGASQSATSEAGMHRYITFSGNTATPSLVIGTQTQQGCLFVNDTDKSLMFLSSDSSLQVVVAGATASGVGLVPAGVVMPYGGSASPTGWIMCTGGAISRSAYARLYAVVGTAFGTGDGSTTFNVPDCRGKAIVGKSAAGIFATLGATTGEETHTLTVAEMPAHTHTVTVVAGGGDGAYVRSNESAASQGTPNTSSAGSGNAHNNVQPSIVMNCIIKD